MIPALLKYELQKGKYDTDFKANRLQQCLEWFPTNESKREKFAVVAFVYSDSSPIFGVFSIDYGDSLEVVQLKLTAYACENKAMFATFPR